MVNLKVVVLFIRILTSFVSWFKGRVSENLMIHGDGYINIPTVVNYEHKNNLFRERYGNLSEKFKSDL